MQLSFDSKKRRTKSWQKSLTVLPLVQIGSRDWHVSRARCHPRHDHCYQKPDQTWVHVRIFESDTRTVSRFRLTSTRCRTSGPTFSQSSSAVEAAYIACIWNVLGPGSCHIISWGRCECEVDKRSVQLSFSEDPCKWKGNHSGSKKWYQGMANGFGPD